MERKANGHFKESLVRVGDLVRIDVGSVVLGLEANHCYRVKATMRSNKEHKTAYNGLQCSKPEQFLIINDLGERMIFSLPTRERPRFESAKVFGTWEVIKTVK